MALIAICQGCNSVLDTSGQYIQQHGPFCPCCGRAWAGLRADVTDDPPPPPPRPFGVDRVLGIGPELPYK